MSEPSVSTTTTITTVTPSQLDAKKFPGYAKLLKILSTADNLEHMRQLAVQHISAVPKPPDAEKHQLTALNWDNADELAKTLMPVTDEKKDDYNCVLTTGNGDCFFNSLSWLVFGHKGRSIEMRCRCVLDVVLNSQKYLDPEFLARGAEHLDCHGVLEFVAKRSGFMAEAMQSPDDYEKVFFIELKKMASAGLDVGLWAFFPATNVIGCPIASWFPVLPDDADQEVHHQCHHTFLPTESAHMQPRPPMMIQWTQSHGDSHSFDHFIPVMR